MLFDQPHSDGGAGNSPIVLWSSQRAPGVFYVCFSEFKGFLEFLRPKKVHPNVLPDDAHSRVTMLNALEAIEIAKTASGRSDNGEEAGKQDPTFKKDFSTSISKMKRNAAPWPKLIDSIPAGVLKEPKP